MSSEIRQPLAPGSRSHYQLAGEPGFLTDISTCLLSQLGQQLLYVPTGHYKSSDLVLSISFYLVQLCSLGGPVIFKLVLQAYSCFM